MGLLSFLKRKSEPQKAKPSKASAKAETADSVQRARIRARQRLVGSVVLVVAGVVGFPLLFETQPRQLPVDIPIEIARKDAALPAPASTRASPAPKSVVTAAPDVIVESASNETRDAAAAPAVAASLPPPPAAQSPKPAVVAEAQSEPAPAPAPTPPAPKPEAKPVEAVRAASAPEGKEFSSKTAAISGSRFVVQVGAFIEPAAAKDARQKLEKLGLKTYTQMVESSTGKRIRVRAGPFESRDEANKAASKIKALGLPSVVYTL